MQAAEQFSSTKTIIDNIFNLKRKRPVIGASVKMLYWEHVLKNNWQEICGANLARNCEVYSLKGEELHIRTANSMLSNELYMMQDLFLKKINKILQGNLTIKKVYFHTAGAIRRAEKKAREAEYVKKEITLIPCPSCGAMISDEYSLCCVCKLNAEKAMHRRITELLQLEPWVCYEECRVYLKCDKITFSLVKDNFKNYFFEKVQNGSANKKESLMAVLLLTEKHPEELTEQLYENALMYLRRKQSVSAFGSGLHGEKQ